MEVKTCRVCLCSGPRLQSLEEKNVKTAFEDIIGLKVGLLGVVPKHICRHCKARVLWHAEFRKWCRNIQVLLHKRIRSQKQKNFHILKNLRNEVKETFPIDHLRIAHAFKYTFSGKYEPSKAPKRLEEIRPHLDKLFEGEQGDVPNKLNSTEKSAVIDEFSVGDDTFDDDYMKTEDDYGETPEDNKDKLLEEHDYSFKGKEDVNDEEVVKEEPFEKPDDNELVKIETKNCNNYLTFEITPLNIKKKVPEKRKRAKSKKKNSIKKTAVKKTENTEVISKLALYNKDRTDENIKKYNMQLNILTKEQQIKKMLVRKECARYKYAEHRCELCVRVFTSSVTLEKHLQMHQKSPRRSFECELCHIWYNRTMIWQHRTRHEKEFVCRECGQEVALLKMKGHFEFHSGVTHTCKECGHVFHQFSTYKNHLRIRHADVPCALCGELFNGGKGLWVHVKRAHVQDANAQCDECKQYFNDKEALQAHLGGCNNALPCGWCGQSVRDAKELIDHIAWKHARTGARKEYACHLCGAEFHKKHHLQEHRRLKHPGQKRGYQRHPRPPGPPAKVESVAHNIYDSCHLDFVNQKRRAAACAALRKSIHYKICSALRCVDCVACVSAYAQPNAWLQVVKTRPPVVCELCGKIVRYAYMKQHMQRHTGDKPHECDVCHKRFYNRHQMEIHYRLHSGERPFQCSKCPKSFHQWAHMNRHERTHTGLKPYSCEQCPKAYSSKVDRDYHVRTVHHGLPPETRRRGGAKGGLHDDSE